MTKRDQILKTVTLILLIMLANVHAHGQWRKRRNKWPATETELVNKLLGTLQARDTAAFFDLFPTFDTLWGMVLHNKDKSPEAAAEFEKLREHPQVFVEFDPLYNKSIIGNYAHVLAKGEDSGVMWNKVVMARFELHASAPHPSLSGFRHVIPERFQGYLFVNDRYNRATYGIKVMEIQKIGNRFFGGQVLNILRSNTVEEFQRKEEMEQAYFAWLAEHPYGAEDTTAANADSTATSDTTEKEKDIYAINRDDVIEDEDPDPIRKEVIDRKYYEGKLDNDDDIALYIRFMKQSPGRDQQYDGLYRLGNNKRYVRIELRKNAEGKWIIEDELAMGVMELKLKGRTFTGIWSNADENGYDVTLTETGTPEGKIEMLDRIIDQGLYGFIDEEKYEKQEEKAKRKKEKKLNRKKKNSKKDKDKAKKYEESKDDSDDNKGSKKSRNKNDENED